MGLCFSGVGSHCARSEAANFEAGAYSEVSCNDGCLVLKQRYQETSIKERDLQRILINQWPSCIKHNL